ncbi:cbb3-type cytochrome c oxidase subunit I [Flagellimonas flava]|uniref:Cytochrome C and Quinol oxidase polypeptide I n=1 Tax=Flagellimonas flava TaxID=570519 RepID=A0A1M5K7E8_9FLAO|nr:Cytochrome C and Quinol oxidase polypeptide I [Allomuricauda flava]
MNKLIEKPHLIFLLSIPIIMLIGILSGDSVLDINVHDTYFVIAYLHLAILISILFGIIGIGYWIMQKANRKLSKWLNLIHVVLTVGGLIAIFGIPYLLFDSTAESAFPVFDQIARQNLILILTIFLILFGQLMYLINLIVGIFRKNKTSG